MTRRPALPLVLAALATLAGCGGGSPTGAASPPAGGTPAPTALRAALSAVSAGPAARALVEFGDESALRRLAHAPASVTLLGTTQLDQRWFGLVGFGAPALADAAPQLPRATGIDLFAADRSITVGRSPRAATRLDGARLRGARILAALHALGARPARIASRDGLALGREGSPHLAGPLGALGLVTTLDRAVALPRELAAGAYEEPIAEVLGDAPAAPLASVPAYGQAARCLGDPVAALLGREAEGLVAIGVDRPPPHPAQVTETLCLIGADAQIDPAARALAAAFPGGRPREASLRGRIALARLQRLSGEVRVALRLAPDEPAGLLFALHAGGELDRLLGAPPR